MARSALLNVMVAAADKAGRSLARDFGEVENLQVSRKGPADFVSKADMRAEEIVYRELSKARPSYGFLGEEGTRADGDGQHRWIVDPLDGTTNFLHGVPLFAVSIALERQGDLVAGVIYNPVMDELYVAEKGSGAYMNDRRLRVSGRSDLADCLIGTGLPFMGHGNQVRTLARAAAAVRAGGRDPAARCRSARSRVDGGGPLRWLLGTRPEAVGHGGRNRPGARGRRLRRPTRRGGTSSSKPSSIVAGNEQVHRALLKVVAEAGPAKVGPRS